MTPLGSLTTWGRLKTDIGRRMRFPAIFPKGGYQNPRTSPQSQEGVVPRESGARGTMGTGSRGRNN